jgi:hypothetical protein
VKDRDYDDIRAMLATVSDAGLLPDWWWPRWLALTSGEDGAASYAASTIGLTSPIQRSSVSSS